MITIPKATKPKEVICFFLMDFSTQEDGEVYIPLIKDVYSQFLFKPEIGGIKDDSKESIIAVLKSLLSNSDFKKHDNDFTIVFHKYNEFRTEIEEVIKPFGGTMMVSDKFVSEQMVDVMEELFKN